jgi:hypothetical protein
MSHSISHKETRKKPTRNSVDHRIDFALKTESKKSLLNQFLKTALKDKATHVTVV